MPAVVVEVKSIPGMALDLEASLGDAPSEGVMVNGKYGSMEDIGNMLAGLNVRTHDMEYSRFQQIAGGVHVGTIMGRFLGVHNNIFGKQKYQPANLQGR